MQARKEESIPQKKSGPNSKSLGQAGREFVFPFLTVSPSLVPHPRQALVGKGVLFSESHFTHYLIYYKSIIRCKNMYRDLSILKVEDFTK